LGGPIAIPFLCKLGLEMSDLLVNSSNDTLEWRETSRFEKRLNRDSGKTSVGGKGGGECFGGGCRY